MSAKKSFYDPKKLKIYQYDEWKRIPESTRNFIIAYHFAVVKLWMKKMENQKIITPSEPHGDAALLQTCPYCKKYHDRKDTQGFCSETCANDAIWLYINSGNKLKRV